MRRISPAAISSRIMNLVMWNSPHGVGTAGRCHSKGTPKARSKNSHRVASLTWWKALGACSWTAINPNTSWETRMRSRLGRGPARKDQRHVEGQRGHVHDQHPDPEGDLVLEIGHGQGE